LVLYHHWQLISYADVLDSLRPSVLWQQLGQGLESFYEMRARTATAADGPPREQLLERAADARARELLLVRVQNFFHPRERGHWIGGHVLGLTDDAMEWADQQGREADFAEGTKPGAAAGNGLTRARSLPCCSCHPRLARAARRGAAAGR
jgi:hypothetical protein